MAVTTALAVTLTTLGAHGLLELVELGLVEDLGEGGVVRFTQLSHGRSAGLPVIELPVAEVGQVAGDGGAGFRQGFTLRVGELPAVDQGIQALLHRGTALLAMFLTGLGQGLTLLLAKQRLHLGAVFGMQLAQRRVVSPTGLVDGGAGLGVQVEALQ